VGRYGFENGPEKDRFIRPMPLAPCVAPARLQNPGGFGDRLCGVGEVEYAEIANGGIEECAVKVQGLGVPDHKTALWKIIGRGFDHLIREIKPGDVAANGRRGPRRKTRSRADIQEADSKSGFSRIQECRYRLRRGLGRRVFINPGPVISPVAFNFSECRHRHLRSLSVVDNR
jgi:hypothetical protein